ncbi:MAG: DMT family transporter, partial [Anaerolineae bacterium]
MAGQALWGDWLAFLGAVTAAGYFLIGRRLRAKLSLISYISVVYLTAAVLLVIMALGAGHSFTGYGPRTYAMFLLLAVVPQILGHSSFNWALRYLSATFVTVTILGEPIGSTILAYFILKEVPTLLKMVGGGLILAGIY